MAVRPSRILLIVGAVAAVGVAVLGLLAAQVTSMEKMAADAAQLQIEAVVDSLGFGPPRLTRDGSGKFTSKAPENVATDKNPKKLVVMTYRSRESRLIRTDIPFWFFRLKAPAAQFALKDSGFDMKRLGLRPADITSQGAGLILDEMIDGGDRVLVWAE